jgi:hypothetical protein
VIEHIRMALSGGIAGWAISGTLGASAENANLIALPSIVFTAIILEAFHDPR